MGWRAAGTAAVVRRRSGVSRPASRPALRGVSSAHAGTRGSGAPPRVAGRGRVSARRGGASLARTAPPHGRRTTGPREGSGGPPEPVPPTGAGPAGGRSTGKGRLARLAAHGRPTRRHGALRCCEDIQGARGARLIPGDCQELLHPRRGVHREAGPAGRRARVGGGTGGAPEHGRGHVLRGAPRLPMAVMTDTRGNGRAGRYGHHTWGVRRFAQDGKIRPPPCPTLPHERYDGGSDRSAQSSSAAVSGPKHWSGQCRDRGTNPVAARPARRAAHAGATPSSPRRTWRYGASRQHPVTRRATATGRSISAPSRPRLPRHRASPWHGRHWLWPPRDTPRLVHPRRRLARCGAGPYPGEAAPARAGRPAPHPAPSTICPCRDGER